MRFQNTAHRLLDITIEKLQHVMDVRRGYQTFAAQILETAGRRTRYRMGESSDITVIACRIPPYTVYP